VLRRGRARHDAADAHWCGVFRPRVVLLSGAYAAGTLDVLFGVSDIAVMLLAAVAVTGWYRPARAAAAQVPRHLFAMLSLAFSMILYGLLVKTSALGSSDGFNVAAKTLFGIRIAGTEFERYVIFAVTVLIAFAAAACIHKYLASHMGRLAGRSATTNCASSTWARRCATRFTSTT